MFKGASPIRSRTGSAGTECTKVFSGIVRYVDGAMVLGARNNQVYQSSDGGLTWQHLFNIPLSWSERARSFSRLMRRLFRTGIQHVTCLENRTVVVIANGTIYTYDLLARKLGPEGSPLVGSRPLVLCKADEASLYYGEYRRNPERGPVHVFGSTDAGVSWAPVYRFAGVRHIHGVFRDPYTGGLWVTTGDRDSESAIWLTLDGFDTLERVAGGTQQVRAVQLLFDRDYIYFGSDTPLERNYIYRLDRSRGRIEQLQAVEGPIFYGYQVKGWLFFSTVCEPSEKHSSREVVVWGTSDRERWHPVIRFRKDWWHKRFFQYGQVLFPGGDGDDEHLWLTPYATNLDQHSFKWRVPESRLPEATC